MSQKILIAFMLGTVLATSAFASQPDDVDLALRDVAATSVTEMKNRIFQQPVGLSDGAHRRKAIAELPEDIRGNRITEGSLWRRVERVARPVLQLHNRTGKVELYLYRHRRPHAMVWRGCVLAISDSLTLFLSDEELAGIMAHEMAHAYFMDETLAARRVGDERSMRVVELKCDAVAMLTLKLMGSDPAEYISGLRTLIAHRMSKGHPSNSRWHPRIAERERFSRRFISLLSPPLA